MTESESTSETGAAGPAEVLVNAGSAPATGQLIPRLRERLLEHAALHAELARHGDEEQAQWARDLELAAGLLARPAHEREGPHCPTCGCPPYEARPASIPGCIHDSAPTAPCEVCYPSPPPRAE